MPDIADTTGRTTAQRELLEKQQRAEKKIFQKFREKIQKDIHDFVQDSTKEKHKCKPMDAVYRAIIHEVAEVAGLTSFSFGLDEHDRYVMLWKKEFMPSDEEVLAYREGREWDPVQAKIDSEQRLLADQESKTSKHKVVPAHDYKDKYKHLIGQEAAKDAAISTVTKRSYGFVSSENKRDQRTIEQVMADSKAKRLRVDGNTDTQPDEQGDTTGQTDSSGV